MLNILIITLYCLVFTVLFNVSNFTILFCLSQGIFIRHFKLVNSLLQWLLHSVLLIDFVSSIYNVNLNMNVHKSSNIKMQELLYFLCLLFSMYNCIEILKEEISAIIRKYIHNKLEKYT